MKQFLCLLLSALSISSTGNTASAEKPRKFIYKGSAAFTIRPDRVEDFKAAVAKIILPTRAECGNLEYEAFQVLDSSGKPTNKFEFHELWKSKEAMMIDHKEHAPHMVEFFKAMAIGKPDSMVEEFQVHGSEVQIL